MGVVLPCSLYHVGSEGDDVLNFSALVCCMGVCAFPASGRYRRNNYYDELRYDRADEGLSAYYFTVKSRRRMQTDVGGMVIKLF